MNLSVTRRNDDNRWGLGDVCSVAHVKCFVHLKVLKIKQEHDSWRLKEPRSPCGRLVCRGACSSCRRCISPSQFPLTQGCRAINHRNTRPATHKSDWDSGPYDLELMERTMPDDFQHVSGLTVSDKGRLHVGHNNQQPLLWRRLASLV